VGPALFRPLRMRAARTCMGCVGAGTRRARSFRCHLYAAHPLLSAARGDPLRLRWGREASAHCCELRSLLVGVRCAVAMMVGDLHDRARPADSAGVEDLSRSMESRGDAARDLGVPRQARLGGVRYYPEVAAARIYTTLSFAFSSWLLTPRANTLAGAGPTIVMGICLFRGASEAGGPHLLERTRCSTRPQHDFLREGRRGPRAGPGAFGQTFWPLSQSGFGPVLPKRSVRC